MTLSENQFGLIQKDERDPLGVWVHLLRAKLTSPELRLLA